MNGLRNGKGKEYDKGELSYEGDFVDRKRNGKGKEYSFDGDLLFEGEYLDDQNHGKGKEYKIINGESKLIFEGGYLKGKKWNGKGIIFDYN